MNITITNNVKKLKEAVFHFEYGYLWWSVLQITYFLRENNE